MACCGLKIALYVVIPQKACVAIYYNKVGIDGNVGQMVEHVGLTYIVLLVEDAATGHLIDSLQSLQHCGVGATVVAHDYLVINLGEGTGMDEFLHQLGAVVVEYGYYNREH